MNNRNMRQQTSTGSGERQKINKSSQLLSQDENEQVFSLLGRKCQSLSTSVAQIFKTDGSAHSHWKKKYTGVICFVKDSSKRSYFLRSYCLIKNELSWEHEIYDSIKIIQPRPFLLTFEGQDGHIAINFASDDECEAFYRVANLTIESRNRKRQERRGRPKSQTAPSVPAYKGSSYDSEESSRVTLRNHPNVGSIQITPQFQQPQQQQQQQQSKPMFPAAFGLSNNKDKKKKPKYTKADISTPMNFVHVSHVGWDAQKGFDLTGNEDDDMLKHFFNKAGVSEHELNDRDTRAFIYDFIQNHNVLASVKNERVDSPKDPTPPPPPVPSRQQQPQNGTQRTAPPPPPARQPPPPVPPNAPQRMQAAPIRPPPIQAAQMAPPPPPPPPPTAPIPPPPPPMPLYQDSAPPHTSNELKPPASSLPVVSDMQSELMESIRKGANLRKVDPANLSTGSGDSRGDLMTEIRQGIELRPASERELPSGSNRTSDSGGTDALADALRRALSERGRVIQSSDDESGGSSDNDGEWED